MATIRLATLNRIEQTLAYLINGPPVTVALNSWVNGSPTITRVSAGSNITDGVHKQALLGGTMAAKFPATTRVLTVAATTLTMDKNANVAFTANTDATYTPLSLAYGDASYPMTNIANAQRYTPWDTGNVLGYPATIFIEYDMLAATPVEMFALLGLTWDLNNAGITAARISSGSVYGSFTLRGTVTPASGVDRDKAVSFASVSARYWQIQIDTDVRTSLGGIFMGPIDSDLGVSLAPGSTRSVTLPVSRQQTPGGLPIFNAMGGYRATRFMYRWGALLSTARVLATNAHTNLAINGVKRRIPVLLDENGDCFEVEFTDRSLSWASVFTGVDSVGLELEGLP